MSICCSFRFRVAGIPAGRANRWWRNVHSHPEGQTPFQFTLANAFAVLSAIAIAIVLIRHEGELSLSLTAATGLFLLCYWPRRSLLFLATALSIAWLLALSDAIWAFLDCFRIMGGPPHASALRNSFIRPLALRLGFLSALSFPTLGRVHRDRSSLTLGVRLVLGAAVVAVVDLLVATVGLELLMRCDWHLGR